MDEKFIDNFLEFEKKSNISNILYANKNIWPLIRNSVFHEILKEKNSLQLPANFKVRKNLGNFSIIKLLKNIFDLVIKFNKKKDLILLNYDRKINIDNINQNLLVWSITKSIKNHKILILDTCGIGIKSNNVVDVSYLMKIFRNVSKYTINRHWDDYSKKISALVKENYNIEIDLKNIYSNSYIHQIWIKNITKIFLFFKKPKLVIFSQEGSYPCLINELKIKKIPSIDFQHGMQSGSIPIFKHNKNLSKDYENFLPNYVFTYGEFWNKYYSNYSNPIPVGNPYYEYMISKLKDIHREKNSILIVSDGLLERKKLISLAKKISKSIKDIKIYYKLRTEEYKDAAKDYKELYEFKNIVVIINEDISLYNYIKKSSYVIGINSTVLIEASKFCKVIVYKTGWYYEMNDLIDAGFFILGKSENDIVDIISTRRDPKNIIDISKIYQPNSEKNIATNIDIIIS